jgi:hypothetical protein
MTFFDDIVCPREHIRIMKTYTIDRSKWLNDASALDGETIALYSDKSGRSCCVGLMLQADGVSRSRLKGVKYPPNVKGLAPDWVFREGAHGDLYPKGVVFEMMSVNDSRVSGEASREAELTKLAAELGIELEFVGELFPKEKNRDRQGV